jgi:hypothetical protein
MGMATCGFTSFQGRDSVGSRKQLVRGEREAREEEVHGNPKERRQEHDRKTRANRARRDAEKREG